MLDTFNVLMPTLKHPIRGRVRPVLGARCGVILLQGGVSTETISLFCDELELYLQAAHITCLSIPGNRSSGVAWRARELLAGVTQLRSIGIDRVVLVVISDMRLPDLESTQSNTLLDLLGALVNQSPTMPSLLKAVRSLVMSVRIVAESVAGVATLAPTYSTHAVSQNKRRQPASLRLMRPNEVTRPSPDCAERHDAALASQGSQPAILFALPDPLDAQHTRQRAELLGKLYTWITTTLDVRPSARQMQDVDLVMGGWQDTAHWLETRWAAIVQASIARAQANRDKLQTKLQGSGGFSVIHAAQEAWPYLDIQARLEWLRACAQVFTTSRTPADESSTGDEAAS